MAEKKKITRTKLRPVAGHVHHFAVLGEMTGLLQRVRANKSKRTTSVLSNTGPLRVSVLAFDEGGRLEGNTLDGPFTVQCLLGRVRLTVGGRENRLTTGDLLVAEAGIAHDISADEASVLLFTVSAAEA